jgi:hypothetical protein
MSGSVQEWLDAYVEAWRTYDPEQIGGLFTEDATYSYQPWGEPLRGREAIVADWLADPDDPGTWEAEYRSMLSEGGRAVAVGRTTYADGRTYENLFLIDLTGDGRCSGFVEWYMKHPQD